MQICYRINSGDIDPNNATEIRNACRILGVGNSATNKIIEAIRDELLEDPEYRKEALDRSQYMSRRKSVDILDYDTNRDRNNEFKR